MHHGPDLHLIHLLIGLGQAYVPKIFQRLGCALSLQRPLEARSRGFHCLGTAHVHSETQSPHSDSQKEAGSTPASATHIASAKAKAATRSSVMEKPPSGRLLAGPTEALFVLAPTHPSENV
jgi:hypothetical protein